MPLTVTDTDRGYKALVRSLRAAGGDTIVGKAGIIGAKAETDHSAAGYDTQAGIGRDAQGRFLKGSGAKTHHEHVEGELTNAELAMFHEFGLGVPERSFIRAAFDKNHPKYDENMVKLVRALYDGKITAERVVGLLGAQIASDIRNYIRDSGELLPNAPSTIAAKGSSKPLIDKGQLVNSISSAVVKGSGE